MPQFSVKDLLITTAGVAIGVMMFVGMWKFPPIPSHIAFRGTISTLVLWLGGGAMIGAGILWPLKRPITGAVAGAVIQLLAGMAILILVG